MRSTPRFQGLPLPFILGLGVLVYSGWTGCTANSKGFGNRSAPQAGNNSGTMGGQTGLDGAVGGSPVFDAGDSGNTGGATGTLVIDAGSSGLRDGDAGRGDRGSAAGNGGQRPTDSAAQGGTGSSQDANPQLVDAPAIGIADTGSGSGEGSSDTNNARPDIGSASDAYAVSVDTAPAGDASPWHLVWADEFDRAAETGVDASKWNVVTWDPGAVNDEKQKYTARPQNVFHDGQGHLILRALHDSYTVDGTTFPYTSGRIQTDGDQSKFKFKFGRIEVRAQLPAGRGTFPGIVLMGSSGDWPQCGEIALMEQKGQDKNSFTCSTYSGSQNDLTQKVPSPGASLSSEFHTYALEWTSDRLVFFLDGGEVARKSFSASSPFATANNDFYIILSLALGGSNGGSIDNNAFPMDMVLDYVRVYSFEGGLTSLPQ